MKQNSTFKISTAETIAAIALALWIIAGFFVPLPEINSLGY
ncbi:MAG: hypothetical protein ABJA78_00170 [Ferruginibacter sp.]